MDIAADIAVALADDWLPVIYRDKIRAQRTRSLKVEVPARENNAEIQYTLLGIELKIGKHRFACPDLATARYMRVFARFGCSDFAIPYDISKISATADELETSWQRTLLILGSLVQDKPARTAASLRTRLVKAIRTQIEAIGPGDAMPAFDRQTRQRP
ncbi:MAG TPA: hypothetical protein PLP21_10940 [Pyrinomonadaceae bacterium]|nr:hypothetical protein [Acidobacteriota bacterium]HQZ96823.1 hypothetical protein [Pyrinomonadaceae bacterium]